MDYFKILDLNREPFSNSPDPDFFFESNQHTGCLQQVELSIRLKRGLNIVIGDVGTGKTTLCRQLIRRFADDNAIQTYLVLDPSFATATEFLSTVAELFTGHAPGDFSDDWQIKEAIKQYLYRTGVDEKKIVALIIDEGQKIPDFCLEILREFLNYETNEYKLLQIVIFAQKEFQETINLHANFADRINLLHHLGPLSFSDTRCMIQFRLNQSSNSPKKNSIFSFFSQLAIYRATGGYPRKIINLCHRSIMAMIIQNKSRAGWFLVRSCVHRAFSEPVVKGKYAAIFTGALIIIIIAGFAVWMPDNIPLPDTWKRYVINRLGPEKQPLKYSIDDDKRPSEKDYAVTDHSRDQSEENKSKESTSAALPTTENNNTKSTPASSLLPAGTTTIRKEPVGPEASKTPSPITVTAPSAPTPPTETATLPASMAAADPTEISPGSSVPAYLGSINIKEGDTLSHLCDIVYGSTGIPGNGFKHLESIMSANPHIPDPNLLEIGQWVAFPAIPVSLRSPGPNGWMVEISRYSSLNDAFLFVRSYAKHLPKIRMMPFWSLEKGLQFPIILWEIYFDKITAQNRLDRLHHHYTIQASLSEIPKGKIVFFSPPAVFGGLNRENIESIVKPGDAVFEKQT